MAETILSTENASKHFDGLMAVNRVTYALKEGESTGVIGPNGAGKSTFFNLLTGLFKPSEGRVFYHGKDITRMPAYERVNRGIARTFQLVSVFDTMTVLENMMLARIRMGRNYQSKFRFFFKNVRHRALMDECLKALDMMGIADKAEIATSDLSYGEKRELEIAIALSLNPKVLLLDEPFAGLSQVEILNISNVIMELKGRFSISIVEHKISKLMELVDRLYVINEGELICGGEPAEVICDPLVRECYWGKEDMVCY
ncbi:MAG: ABC transporter ATP-binding protein [Deltaproteobacteria bacterium]|nr:ABC transporter ATP-binding protein [Deltaproteobacteria bacterium]